MCHAASPGAKGSPLAWVPLSVRVERTGHAQGLSHHHGPSARRTPENAPTRPSIKLPTNPKMRNRLCRASSGSDVSHSTKTSVSSRPQGGAISPISRPSGNAVKMTSACKQSVMSASQTNSATRKVRGEVGRHQLPPPRARTSRRAVRPLRSASVSGDKKVSQSVCQAISWGQLEPSRGPSKNSAPWKQSYKQP